MDLQYVRDIFHPRLEGFKKEFFDYHPDEPVVFHRKELLKGKSPFSSLKNPDVRRRFNEALLNLLAESNYHIIAVLIDKLEHNEGYPKWKHDPYHYCLEVILESFRLLLSQHQKVGDVMIESRGGKEDMRLKESFKKLMDEGTQYLTRAEMMSVYTSKQLKAKPKTANIAGLQLADLIAHPVRRWFFKNVVHRTERENTFADKIIQVIEPRFLGFKGKVLGYGMKKLP
jgi:hypothetical protein